MKKVKNLIGDIFGQVSGLIALLEAITAKLPSVKEQHFSCKQNNIFSVFATEHSQKT